MYEQLVTSRYGGTEEAGVRWWTKRLDDTQKLEAENEKLGSLGSNKSIVDCWRLER
jgi:hypothetical protein